MKLTHLALLSPAVISLFACSSDTVEETQVSQPGQQVSDESRDNTKSTATSASPKVGRSNRSKQAKVAARPDTTAELHAALLSAGQDPAAEMRSLVPSDAFLWVELESMDRLSDLMQEVGALMSGVPIPPASMLLSNLEAFGIQPSDVRPNAPMGMALSMGVGMEPAATFVINVKNAASLAAKLQGAPGMPTPSTSGNAVAITLHESYIADAEHGALLSNDMPEGSITSRLHVAYLMDSFGDQIRQGVDMAKGMAASQPGSDSIQALYEHQADQSIEMLQGTRFISLGLDLDAGDLSLTYSMALEDDSLYARMQRTPGRDLADLVPYVSQQDALVILGSLSKDHLNQLVRPMIDGLALNTSYEDGIQLRAAYANLEALLSADGTSFGLTGYLDQGETDFSMLVQGVEAKQASEHIADLLDGFDSLGESLVATTPVKGFEEDSHFLQYDFVPSPLALTGSKGREAIANLESIFGAPRARMRVVAQGDEAIMTLGEGSSLARKAADGDLDTGEELRWGIESIDGRSPSLLFRMDINRWTQGMARCADGNGFMVPPTTSFDPSTPLDQIPHLWVTSWAVLDQATWEGGLRLDLESILEMGQQLGGLAGPLPR